MCKFKFPSLFFPTNSACPDTFDRGRKCSISPKALTVTIGTNMRCVCVNVWESFFSGFPFALSAVNFGILSGCRSLFIAETKEHADTRMEDSLEIFSQRALLKSREE